MQPRRRAHFEGFEHLVFEVAAPSGHAA
jgi:hypothetical protein